MVQLKVSDAYIFRVELYPLTATLFRRFSTVWTTPAPPSSNAQMSSRRRATLQLVSWNTRLETWLCAAGPLPLVNRVCIPVGDRIVVVVKRTRSLGAEGASSSAIANRVKKGDIRQGVVVRTRQNIQRPDGSVIKFGDNACVLVNKSGDPIGTRVTGEFECFC